MEHEIRLTPLAKTWILDIDGTLAKHNGYRIDGRDTPLPGIAEFLEQIKEEDMVIIVTSRTEGQREETERFLAENCIRYQHLIFGAPYGERILINDKKPSGQEMAIAVNTERDRACTIRFVRDTDL